MSSQRQTSLSPPSDIPARTFILRCAVALLGFDSDSDSHKFLSPFLFFSISGFMATFGFVNRLACASQVFHRRTGSRSPSVVEIATRRRRGRCDGGRLEIDHAGVLAPAFRCFKKKLQCPPDDTPHYSYHQRLRAPSYGVCILLTMISSGHHRRSTPVR